MSIHIIYFLGTKKNNYDDMRLKGREIHKKGHGYYFHVEDLLERALAYSTDNHISMRKTGEIYGISGAHLARLMRDPTKRPDVKRPRRLEGN